MLKNKNEGTYAIFIESVFKNRYQYTNKNQRKCTEKKLIQTQKNATNTNGRK